MRNGAMSACSHRHPIAPVVGSAAATGMVSHVVRPETPPAMEPLPMFSRASPAGPDDADAGPVDDDRLASP